MTYERRDLRGSTEAPGQWNEEAGSFTVVVDQAPQGRQIQNIRVAAWSESN